MHSVIKVADFGLTEEMFSRNYFRQGQHSTVRLPIKWMALESLSDGLFTEATDVVTYYCCYKRRAGTCCTINCGWCKTYCLYKQYYNVTVPENIEKLIPCCRALGPAAQ